MALPHDQSITPSCQVGFGVWAGIHDPDRLAGLVAKASASRAEDPVLDSRSRRGDFSGSSHTRDFNIGIPVASSSSAVDQPCLDPQSTCCQELGGAAQVFRRSPQLGGWLILRP